MGPSPHLWFLHAKQRAFGAEVQSLYGTQTPPVVLCMQNSVISTRIVSLYGPRPHLWFCACKTSTLGPELHVSMGSSPHLWFCALQNSDLKPELQVSMGPRPHLVILCMQNRVPSFRITSPYGSCSHLWFLHAKQPLLYTNNKNLWDPDITCRFVHAKQAWLAPEWKD